MAATVLTRQQEMEKAIRDNAMAIDRIEINVQGLQANSQALTDNFQTLAASVEENTAAMAQMQLQMQAVLVRVERGHNHQRGHEGEQRFGRLGRLDFPKFNGEDVEGWVLKCNHFFDVDHTAEHMKLHYAIVSLEGKALQWHQGYLKSHDQPVENISWDEYVRSITTRFSLSLLEDAMEELKNLHQTGMLQEYCDTFDGLLNKVTIC